MSDVKIRKGIKVPRKNTQKYPWAELEVGDSFIYEGAQTSAYNVAKYASLRNLPKKFVARMVNGKMGIWRAA